MKRWAVAAVACSVATAIVPTVSLSQPWHRAPHIARACPPVQLIGVRGSGETRKDAHGYGTTAASLLDWMRVIDGQVTGTPVDYQALKVRPFDPRYYAYRYNHSVGSGITALQNDVREFLSSCHQSQLDLVGFSQGAQVVADTYLGSFSAAERSRVNRIVLYGDPKFKGRQPGPVNTGSFSRGLNGIVAQTTAPRVWPTSDWGKVRSYCADGDPICNFYSVGQAAGCGALPATCPHLHYSSENLPDGTTYTLNGARFLMADKVVACSKETTWQPPPPYQGSSLIIDGLHVAAVSCAVGRVIAGRIEYGGGKLSGWTCTQSSLSGPLDCRNGYQQVDFSPGGDAG